MKRIFVILVVGFLCIVPTFATIIKSEPAEIKQSDGTTLTIIPYGDERVSWYRTIDDYTLMIAPNKDYVYAIEDGEGGMKISSVIAHNPGDRTQEEIEFLKSIRKNLFYSQGQVDLMRQYIDANIDYSKKVARLKADSDEIEDYKMVVILMSYKDRAFTTPKEDVDNLFNQVGYSQNGHPGSVHDYFVASSSGKLNLSATVLGPYVSDSVLSYYGKQEGGTNDLHVRELIREAVKKADDDIDYSEYTNGDPSGFVSCVYVLYAGYSQAVSGNSSDFIWPHRSTLYPPLTLDGVKIRDYGCSSELEGREGLNSPMKIGTICHEFSHVLGQPDYYDTNYEEQGRAFNPGTWDLMAGGNYNGDGAFPPLWHAMERSVRNYVKIEEGQNGNDYTLHELGESAKAIRLNFAGLPNEYFLLENRQLTGFDTYLPGHGLIIYKVDRNVAGWNSNCSNCDTSRLGFELITANTDRHVFAWGGFTYGQEQPFPGSTNNRQFTDSSIPSSKSYDGLNLGKPLYRITENENTKNITLHIGDTANLPYIYNSNYVFFSDTIVATASVNKYSTNITEKGLLYSPSSNLTEANATKIIDNTTSDNSISANLTALENNQIYYIRPYAKTSNGISYGEIMKVKTPCQSITMFPFEEDFTNGIEDCWGEENFVYVANHWKISENNDVYIKSDFTRATWLPAPQIKLITPPLNTTVLDKPMLTFRHLQKSSSGANDILHIYYKTSQTGNWTFLASYPTATNTWETKSIDLPVKSKTLFIGFEAEMVGGAGVNIDNVVVTDKTISSWPKVNISPISNITDNQATFKANVVSAGYTNLVSKGFVLSEQSSPTMNDIVIYATDNNTGNYEITYSSLMPSTEYHVRAFAQNEGMISYSTELTFITKCAKITDFPYSPDLSSIDTICFDKQDKLILPILDLSYKDSMKVIYNATRNTADMTIHHVKVYYRDGVDGAWELLNSTADPNQTITIDIPILNHQSENAYIGFEGVGLSGNYNYLFDNITVKAVSQIAFVSTDSIALPEYNKIYVQGSISYEGMTDNSERGFVYSKNNNPTIADTKVSVGKGVGEFNATIQNLEPLTTYYVRAFATNSYGTAYGRTLKVTTPYIPIFNNRISEDQQLCEGTVPAILNGEIPTGGNGTYEYLWISSTDGENWDTCDEGSVVTNTWYEPHQLFGTTYYKRIVTSYLSVDTSNMVTIKIDQASRGGNVFSMQREVEQNQEATFQLRAHLGTILYWERLRPGYDWVEIENSAEKEYLTDKPTDIGQYSYRAVVRNGVCRNATSGEDVVNVKEGVGFEAIDGIDFDITLSPNPTSEFVYLNYNGLAQNVNITITDSKGNQVYSNDVVLQQGENKLNLEFLPKGSFVVTIQSEKIHKNLKLIVM